MTFKACEAAGLIGDRTAEERVKAIKRVTAISAAGSEGRPGKARQSIHIEKVEERARKVAIVRVEGSIRSAVEGMPFKGAQIIIGQSVQLSVKLLGNKFLDEEKRLPSRRGKTGRRTEDGQKDDENRSSRHVSFHRKKGSRKHEGEQKG